jgi:acyl-coenzyme A synthetase/AMP-(fatty) acid ligase/3-hydroxymyristoyl/3-hydroxydecanoyl-(acyl carrier protein) dehydratase
MSRAHDAPTAAVALPLTTRRRLDDVLAWVDGRPVTTGRFLAEALALAEHLPSRGEVVNLCDDRYRFALGFAAALCRGLPSLFPPNARPDTLALLAADGAPRTALVDGPEGALPDTGGLPAVHVARPVVAEGAPAPTVPAIPAEQVAACLLTSGSTGVPQPHAKRWHTLTLNIAAEAGRLAEMLGRPDLTDLTLVATVPPQHSYGFESSVLLALLGGACFDAGRPFYPADIVEALARVPRPRALVTTPFHLKALLGSGAELPPVDLILSATAPLSPQLAAQAERATGAALIEIYGCTEAGQVAARRTTQGDLWQTMGELRLSRRTVDLADPTEADAVFEVHGGHVAEPTPLADLLELQDARHFRLIGRANDLIHVAGKRSSLAHLNFHLNRIEGVDDGCFWLPEDDGETVARTVVFAVAPRLDARALVAALRERIEPAFLPRRVVFVEALPREATGKLTAQALRRFAAERLAGAAGAVRAGTHVGPDAGRSTVEVVAAAEGADAAVKSADGPWDVTWTVPADHPAFDGHFPGHPVLPGVALLSQVLATALAQPALAAALGSTPVIDSAKFLAPVGPDSTLVTRLSRRATGGIAFDVQRGDTVVARGVLRPGAQA